MEGVFILLSRVAIRPSILPFNLSISSGRLISHPRTPLMSIWEFSRFLIRSSASTISIRSFLLGSPFHFSFRCQWRCCVLTVVCFFQFHFSVHSWSGRIRREPFPVLVGLVGDLKLPALHACHNMNVQIYPVLQGLPLL